MIYLDNAATSWPKPAGVGQAMARALDEAANPGRGAHGLALNAGRILFRTRRAAARMFGTSPDRVVLTTSATHALNLVIAGMLRPGDHAVTTDLEHNSVLRPLYASRAELSIVPSERGVVSPGAIAAAIRPDTRLVVVAHASNVLGTVQPIAEIAAVCAARGVPLLVDAAQTVGVLPLSLAELPGASVACGGHKGLLGPSGTGLLLLADGVTPRPLLVGGTGFDTFNHAMPPDLPESLEAGTPNMPGYAGLEAALELFGQAPYAIAQPGIDQAERLRAGLAERGCWQPVDAVAPGVPVVSGSVIGRSGRLLDSEAVADALWERAEIAVRGGYHCAPLVHELYGTGHGLVRFSPGHATTPSDVDAALAAVAELARQN